MIDKTKALAAQVKKLKASHACAMQVLRQIADGKRRTREQKLASACVIFLDSMTPEVK